jgi:hypothetical protein
MVSANPQVTGDARMSRVIQAPFIPLLTDRAIRITKAKVKHTHLIYIYGVQSGISANGPVQYRVIVERRDGDVWIKDETSTITPASASQCSTYDGTRNSPKLLQVYKIELKDHVHHHRRVRVDECEMRTSYQVGTMAQGSKFPFWTSFGRPVKIPY